jgi:hypothetical protein
MAVLQWTALVTSMKGKLRGSVLQMGAGGQILRSNKTSNQYGNPRWAGSKLALAATVSAWQALSPSDRATWSAATVNFPTTDRYGNTHYPSPYTLYMRLNGSLNYHTGLTQTTAPGPQVFPSLGTVALAADTTPSIVVTWSNATFYAGYLVISASSCMSNGRSANKGLYSGISKVELTGQLSFDITSAYITRWGQIIPGTVIYVKAQILNYLSGQLSPVYPCGAYVS